ncbi:Competence protein ComM [compost metagenome]
MVPRENAEEASLASGLNVLAVGHLLELTAHFAGHTPLMPYQAQGLVQERPPYPDLADVQGQVAAKRALLVAAAGSHNLLFCGPPGTGKTLLASRLPGLLPPLEEDEALEVAAIHSVASHAPLRAWPQRPFRHPHHSASGAALVGGGSRPKPGEITLAHQGVLFLDELPEFDRKVLEVLREPLESGEIVIARAQDKLRFPARFQLVAAMNPCPCGYLGDAEQRCRCTPEQVQRYRSRLSGPLLDRIDLHLHVRREPTRLHAASEGPDSAALAQQVAAAQQLQQARQGCANAHLDLPGLRQHCPLGEADRLWLESAGERLRLSLRALHRVLKVARTLADLAGIADIQRAQLAEALQYRAPGESG